MDYVKYAEIILSIVEKGEKIMFAVAIAIITTMALHLSFEWNLYLCVGFGLLLGVVSCIGFDKARKHFRAKAEKKDPENIIKALGDSLDAEMSFRIIEYTTEVRFNQKSRKMEHAKIFNDLCFEHTKKIKALGLDPIRTGIEVANLNKRNYIFQCRMKDVEAAYRPRGRDSWMG